jgi:ParB family chromosome partitioning protein
MVKQVLGRGLGALLNANTPVHKPATETAHPAAPVAAEKVAPAVAAPPAAPAEKADPRERILQVPLNKIQPCPFQPRKEFSAEAIKELADSIREQGIIQPLVVRAKGDFYELIAGERRWRASQSLNLPTVPIIVREADDTQVLELSLIENLQRENLNALEEAMGYEQLITQFKLTQEQAATKVGKSRAAVANALRLLKLPGELQAWLREGRLTVGHAKVILSLTSDEEQYLAGERVLRDSLNVRQLEELVAHWQGQTNAPAKNKKPGSSGSSSSIRDPHVVDVERKIFERFGTKVTLRYRQGKGSVEIRFYSDDELERIFSVAGIKID